MNAQKTREQLLSGEMRRVCSGLHQGGEDRGFCPIATRVVRAERLPFTLYLKTLEGKAQRVKYLPYCEAGEIFQDIYLTRLQERGITQLYFREEDLDQAIAYFNDTLLILENEGPEANRKKMMVFFEHVHLTIRRAWAAPLSGPRIHQASWHVDWLVKQLGQGMFPYHSLWEMLFGDYSLYKHAVNVFLLAVAFMVFGERNHGECKAMGIAALFHDMGLIKVPSAILYKPGPLTPEERSKVQKHPEIAVEMLKEYPEIPPESLRLILEHHENADGSGYPRGIGILEQYDCTSVLRLVDAYDALISQRPYRPAHTPFQALTIIQQHGPEYNRELIEKFIRFLAL